MRQNDWAQSWCVDVAVEELTKLEVVWVDSGYSGPNFAQAVRPVCKEQVRVEVIERTSKAFEVLPQRWIERAHILVVESLSTFEQRL